MVVNLDHRMEADIKSWHIVSLPFNEDYHLGSYIQRVLERYWEVLKITVVGW